jgi:hypothetical protein
MNFRAAGFVTGGTHFLTWRGRRRMDTGKCRDGNDGVNQSVFLRQRE